MKHCGSAAPRWAGRISTRCREASAKVTFRLGDGRMLDLAPGDQLLRRIDHAWTSTVHAFEGGTVDTVIAAMEAKHPNLTYAVRLSANYRVTFGWDEDSAVDVDIEDYHR